MTKSELWRVAEPELWQIIVANARESAEYDLNQSAAPARHVRLDRNDRTLCDVDVCTVETCSDINFAEGKVPSRCEITCADCRVQLDAIVIETFYAMRAFT